MMNQPDAPQFRYTTPIEDKKHAHDILTRALDAKVSVSVRELLSCAPDARRELKDLTTTKRLAAALLNEESSIASNETETASAFHNSQLGPRVHWSPAEFQEHGIVTALEIEKLRCVYPTVDDRMVVEFILDSGSQIIAMRRDIWLKLALPLNQDDSRSMETANSSSSRTSGLLKNLKVRFGTIELFLQVHIVDNAPFEVLCGRPFYTLTSCRTQDFANGDQIITITDPNNPEHSKTLPTEPRRQFQESIPARRPLTGF